jgi:hypothetical protein
LAGMLFIIFERFKNRLVVVLQRAWSYMSFRRGARLIVNKE